MDLKLLKEQVEKLLANDKLEEVIDLIQDEIAIQEVKNELINLKRRFKGNETKFHQGLINTESYTIEKNKLVHSILHIFADLMGEVKTFEKSNKELLRSRLAELSSQKNYEKEKLKFYSTKENVSLFSSMVDEVFIKLENDLNGINIDYPDKIKFQKRDFFEKYVIVNFGNKSVLVKWNIKYSNSVKGASLKIVIWDKRVSIIDREFYFPSGDPAEISQREYYPIIDTNLIPAWEVFDKSNLRNSFYDNNSIVEYILGKIVEYIE